MIQQAKKNIDLLQIVESAGVELKRSGPRYCGLCPFHSEKTPSFFVFQTHFHCFSCGAHGDAIDFVQRLHGLTFQDALKHLGIEQGPVTPKIKQDIARRKRKAELVKKFRDWEQRYCWDVSDLWFHTNRLMKNGIPSDDLELYAPLLHMLPVWEYHRDILINGTDKQKFLLFKEAQRNGKFQFSG